MSPERKRAWDKARAVFDSGDHAMLVALANAFEDIERLEDERAHYLATRLPSDPCVRAIDLVKAP